MILRWILISLFFCSLLIGDEPVAVYATVQNSPDTCMTVCWIENEGPAKRHLIYRLPESPEWGKVEVIAQSIQGRSGYKFYSTELKKLNCDARYEVFLTEKGKPYYFHTLPSQLQRPVKIIVGGDAYHDKIHYFEAMNRVAAALNPDLAIMGGDIAYAGSKFSIFRDNLERWIQFLKTWSNSMIKPDGTMIPIIPVIGNHDVNGRFEQTPEQAVYFYFFFPTAEKKYRQLNIGDFLSLWLLDSGHAHPVEGVQTEWLENTLKQSETPFKLAIYHVPAFPSVRSYNYEKSQTVRRNWSPLFETHQLTAAFEHHDHAYKRTHPIKGGKVDSAGVLYLGDGAWGVESPRRPRSSDSTWYLARTEQVRHVILMTFQGACAKFQAINYKGEVFDTCFKSQF